MNTNSITASLLGLAVIGSLIIWASNRPAIQPQAFDGYEACVSAEYGTTPTAFYQMHGSYPECSADQRMEALTIRIYASSEGGYLYDIYKDDVVDEDLTETSEDGGHCTTTMLNALGMAVDQAEQVIKQELGDECPGCWEKIVYPCMSRFGHGVICNKCKVDEAEGNRGDFIGQRQPMDCDQMEALRNVIEYMREAEQKHYEEASEDDRRHHIYQDVLTLEAYLDGDPNEMDDADQNLRRGLSGAFQRALQPD